jgi:sulfur-oxidizing protein SoxX
MAAAVVLLLVPAPRSESAESWPTESECGKLENPSAVTKGWCTTINRRKGNCLACHTISVQPWPATLPEGGNLAPPLVSMKARFPDQEKLFKQIWDPTSLNDHSRMPPFGKHKLLSEQEIRSIIEFLHTI